MGGASLGLVNAGFVIYPYTCAGVADRDLFDRIVAIAETAEHSGFDSLWVGDHLYAQQTADLTEPFLEAYTVLAGLAVRTQHVRLGTLVSPVTFRNPALLAKIVTTLDVMSKGRAILGVGAGWNEAEHQGYGIRFPPTSERMDRMNEFVQICRAMFDSGTASFRGTYYSVSNVFNYPRPVQERIPILVGGGGERRTLRIVAEHADACNITGSLTQVRHKLGVLERHATEAGRDPGEITKTALKVIIVRDTPNEALRASIEARSVMGMDERAFAGYAIVGDPDQVYEYVMSFLSAGLDGILCIPANPFALAPEEVVAAGEVFARAGLIKRGGTTGAMR